MQGRGSGLSCLTTLKVAFKSSHADSVACHLVQTDRLVGMFEPMLQFVNEKIHCGMICDEPQYVRYCNQLVGCVIEEKAEGFDTWKVAHVIAFDSSTGRHSLLYANGNSGTPLVWRLLSSLNYRIVRGVIESSSIALAAEADLSAEKLEAERKQAKKRKAGGHVSQQHQYKSRRRCLSVGHELPLGRHRQTAGNQQSRQLPIMAR